MIQYKIYWSKTEEPEPEKAPRFVKHIRTAQAILLEEIGRRRAEERPGFAFSLYRRPLALNLSNMKSPTPMVIASIGLENLYVIRTREKTDE